MFILLPFLSFFLLTKLLKIKNKELLWREALLISFLFLGSLIFISTEIFSVFRLFGFKLLVIFWSCCSLVLLLLNFKESKNKFAWNFPDIQSFSILEKILLGLVLILAIVLGVIAIYVPPNTWDAMTYHMSRVVHWIQNGTVGFYPTHIERQLYINPFAEYWIAHFQILFQGDYFANSVQWLSMVGSIVGVSLISRELGMGRLGQILSAFFVITLPNAIVEATSTQNDFVATLWSVIAVYFILRNIQQFNLKNTLAIAAAVFLALYTKGSTLFILVPFLAWMMISCFPLKYKNLSISRKTYFIHIGLVVMAFALSLSLLLGKNFYALGSSVYPLEKGHLLALTDLKGIASNLLLHNGMHLRLGIPQVDNVLGGWLEVVHQWMGMTILTSPANIGSEPFNYQDFPFLEDEVPNFIFFVVLIGAVILSLKKREWMALKGKFFLISFLCFFIFNSLVKWSPFDGRYHLLFFVLLAPFLADFLVLRKKALIVLIIVFTLGTVPFIVFNRSKPFKDSPIQFFYMSEPLYGGRSIFNSPRMFEYFYNQPGLGLALLQVAKGVADSGCKDVGLMIGGDTWEYPFWAYLQNNGSFFRIEHVLVGNSSKKLPYPLGNFSPCAIVSSQREGPSTLFFAGKFYVMTQSTADFSLYRSAAF